jgi:hypothetical protein
LTLFTGKIRALYLFTLKSKRRRFGIREKKLALE